MSYYFKGKIYQSVIIAVKVITMIIRSVVVKVIITIISV